MTETRPALTEDLTGTELLRWYWLRTEIASFARSVGVAASGNKQELTARVAAHLDGVDIPPAVSGAPRALASALVEPLTSDTPIPAGQKCTQQLRRYFTEVLGPSFRFDAAMRDFITTGEGQTLGDAVDHWINTRSRPRPEIGAQFELNRFLRAWHRDHPDGNRKQALEAWRAHRARPAEARESHCS